MSQIYPLIHLPADLKELVGHGHVRLTDGDTIVAVIVPFTEFEQLQRLEDEADIAEAERINQQAEWISHEDVLRILELDASDPA